MFVRRYTSSELRPSITYTLTGIAGANIAANTVAVEGLIYDLVLQLLSRPIVTSAAGLMVLVPQMAQQPPPLPDPFNRSAPQASEHQLARPE